jgi:ABC-type antimicrobial peptide transport system permease subunit
MIEAFIGAFFGAIIGVVSGAYMIIKAAKITGTTVGFFEIYEDKRQG